MTVERFMLNSVTFYSSCFKLSFLGIGEAIIINFLKLLQQILSDRSPNTYHPLQKK